MTPRRPQPARYPGAASLSACPNRWSPCRFWQPPARRVGVRARPSYAERPFSDEETSHPTPLCQSLIDRVQTGDPAHFGFGMPNSPVQPMVRPSASAPIYAAPCHQIPSSCFKSRGQPTYAHRPSSPALELQVSSPAASIAPTRYCFPSIGYVHRCFVARCFLLLAILSSSGNSP